MSAIPAEFRQAVDDLKVVVAGLHAELPRNNLVVWTAGNVSARVPGADLLVIKPSGVSYDDLTPEAMVVCDFEATGLEGAERGPAIRTVVTASRGRVGGEAAYPVVGQDGWRAIFDIDFADLPPDEDEPIDLRVYVEHDGKAATETLILQLFPSQLREMLAATN